MIPNPLRSDSEAGHQQLEYARETRASGCQVVVNYVRVLGTVAISTCSLMNRLYETLMSMSHWHDNVARRGAAEAKTIPRGCRWLPSRYRDSDRVSLCKKRLALLPPSTHYLLVIALLIPPICADLHALKRNRLLGTMRTRRSRPLSPALTRREGS